ncbi:MAG: alpha/beta fold hydrolase [Thermoplasmata archaeon]
MENFYETDRGKIFYKVEGEGNPILMVHGFADNSNYMEFLSSELNGYKRILVDLPCHGKSDDFSFSLDDIVKYFDNILENLSLNSYYILGHSLGSIISEYVLIKSRKAKKGIFISPSTRIDDKIIEIISSWISDEEESLKYAYDEGFLEKNYEFIKKFEEENEYDFSRFSNIAEVFINLNIEGLKSNKECLAIVAKNDKIFGKEYYENIKNIFNNCKIEMLDGGHSLILEKPKELSQMIKQFLNGK